MQQKNPLVAALMSLVIPGAGHVYIERFTTGVVLAAVYIGVWLLILLTPGAQILPFIAGGLAVGAAGAAYLHTRATEGMGVGVSPDGGGALTPIPVERFAREIEQMARDLGEGTLSRGAYDQRLARTISELRNRKIAGDRSAIVESLEDLKSRGLLDDSTFNHLVTRFGL